ncbi:MAG: hypothetical protein O9345_01095 [Burkholderiaceae bacterium]|nr:hypothetical protein [Burkholderiales bacterium]MCZ8336753.1 hypothetical protein [Burkholderiaceae bacterium]
MPDLVLARRSSIVAPLALAAPRAHAQDTDPLLPTDARRDWIREHPVVRFTVSFEARPPLFLDGGRPAGDVLDLLQKASRRPACTSSTSRRATATTRCDGSPPARSNRCR